MAGVVIHAFDVRRLGHLRLMMLEILTFNVADVFEIPVVGVVAMVSIPRLMW